MALEPERLGDYSTILLSICVPTYNRSALLRECLQSISQQLLELTDMVELIVVDNCSTDATTSVVTECLANTPFLYFRNASNIGGTRNFDACVRHASGKYVWLIGDDDILLPGSLRKVLHTLEAFPSISLVVVDVLIGDSSNRTQLIDAVNTTSSHALGGARRNPCVDILDWNSLIDPDISSVFLGSVMRLVFMRSLWIEEADRFTFQDAFGSSLASVYPHCIVLAVSMPGRMAAHLVEECVLAFYGHQEWMGYVPLIHTRWLLELLDFYEQNGVPAGRIDRCIRYLYAGSGGSFLRIVLNQHCAGRQYFSLSGYLRRSWKYGEFYTGIARAVLRWSSRVVIR